jgi:ClpP class serine protease
MLPLSHLLASLSDRPLAMAADHAASALAVFQKLDLAAVWGELPAGGTAAQAPYELSDGVATIALRDQIVHRSSWLSKVLGFTALDRFRAALGDAVADPAVRSILIDVDSPGGDFAGAVEAAASVRAAVAHKPVVAFVDGCALSAAYVVAAGATRVVVAPSATVGSIGVVYLHLDRSRELAARGLKPTLLVAGAQKADGSTTRPLPPDAQRRIQNQVNNAHKLLLASVGGHRPKLGFVGARKTEAGLFIGAKAVAAGLADAVGTLADAKAYLLKPAATSPVSTASRSPPSPSIGANPMPAASPAISSIPPLLPPLPGGHLYAPAAVRRAVDRAQRRAAANAEVARQLGGKSIDTLRSDSISRLRSHRAPTPAIADAPTKPAAAQTTDEMWREIAAKQKFSPIQSCFR